MDKIKKDAIKSAFYALIIGILLMVWAGGILVSKGTSNDGVWVIFVLFFIGVLAFYFSIQMFKDIFSSKSDNIKQENTEKRTTGIIAHPVSLTQQRELRMSLLDGEYRFFQNYYIGGEQYTFGFPKDNCSDKRIWIGKGTKEIERISEAEAQLRIGKINSSSSTRYL